MCPDCFDAPRTIGPNQFQLHHKLHCHNVKCPTCGQEKLTSQEALFHYNQHNNLGNVCNAISRTIASLNEVDDMALATQCVWKAAEQLFPLISNPSTTSNDPIGKFYLQNISKMVDPREVKNIKCRRITNDGKDRVITYSQAHQ